MQAQWLQFQSPLDCPGWPATNKIKSFTEMYGEPDPGQGSSSSDDGKSDTGEGDPREASGSDSAMSSSGSAGSTSSGCSDSASEAEKGGGRSRDTRRRHRKRHGRKRSRGGCSAEGNGSGAGWDRRGCHYESLRGQAAGRMVDFFANRQARPGTQEAHSGSDVQYAQSVLSPEFESPPDGQQATGLAAGGADGIVALLNEPPGPAPAAATAGALLFYLV
jgi:hypothetical protein